MLPYIHLLLVVLAVPYVTAFAVLRGLGLSATDQVVAWRRIYPLGLLVWQVFLAGKWAAKACLRMYDSVRRDRYLVGETLVNHDAGEAN